MWLPAALGKNSAGFPVAPSPGRQLFVCTAGHFQMTFWGNLSTKSFVSLKEGSWGLGAAIASSALFLIQVYRGRSYSIKKQKQKKQKNQRGWDLFEFCLKQIIVSDKHRGCFKDEIDVGLENFRVLHFHDQPQFWHSDFQECSLNLCRLQNYWFIVFIQVWTECLLSTPHSEIPSTQQWTSHRGPAFGKLTS